MSRSLVAVATVILAACSAAAPPPSPSVAVARPSATAAQTTAARTPSPTLVLLPGERDVHASAFHFAVPQAWAGSQVPKTVDRATLRYAWAASRGAEPPDPSASWAPVPGDTVVIELWEQVSPPEGAEVRDTPVPTSWSAAERSTRDGFEVRRVRFRYALHPFVLVAHIGRDATPADRAAIDRTLASLTPDPVPDTGAYLDLFVVGTVADVAVGAVKHVDVGVPPAKFGMFVARGTRSLFAYWDEALVGYGPLRPCALRYDVPTFVCDRTGDRWTRVGTPLTLDVQFALAWAPVTVIDGLILIKPSRNTGPLDRSEVAEFGGGVVSVPSAPATRDDIVARTKGLSSAGGDAAAKLVSGADLARSGLLPGLQPPDRLWLGLSSGEIRLQGSNDLLGRWSLLAFDLNGKLLGASCCGPGDRPPGFDALPDLAR